LLRFLRKDGIQKSGLKGASEMPTLSRRERLRGLLELPRASKRESGESLPGPVLPVASSPIVPVSMKPEMPERKPTDELAAWQAPFARWLESACMRDRRCSSGVGCLHRRFSEWNARQGGSPSNRAMFQGLIRESGFLISEGLVSGLVTRDVLEEMNL